MSSRTRPLNVKYGFRLNPRPSYLHRYAVLCCILSVISILISWFSVKALPSGFLGIGSFYFASIFYALITFWFGGWGLIASFIGALIGSGLLAGVPPAYSVPFALADIWEPLIPFVILRLAPRFGMQIDPLGGNIVSKASYLIFYIIFGAIIPPIVSGVWATWILTEAGVVASNQFEISVFKWWLGAALLLAFFVPAICKSLAGHIGRADLACHGFFS